MKAGKWSVHLKIEYRGNDLRDRIELVQHDDKWFARMGNHGSIYLRDLKTLDRVAKAVKYISSTKKYPRLKEEKETLEAYLNSKCI